MFGPSKNDVLCGRGGLSNNHPGNRLFRRLVNVNKALYQQSLSPTHKQMVALSIVEAIRNHGGRFIRKQNGDWVEISTKEASIKTSQALRESIDNSDSCSSSSSQSVNSASRSKDMKVKPKHIVDHSTACCGTPLSRQGDDNDRQRSERSPSMASYSDHSESSQSQSPDDDFLEVCDLEPLSLGQMMGSWLTPELREFLVEVASDPVVVPGQSTIMI